jgi:2-oxoglutarate ferredoxin oxidoreductase subunit alpha
MVPVIVLSDGFLANGSSRGSSPTRRKLPPIEITFRTEQEGFFPYLRDPATLARPWVRPGTPVSSTVSVGSRSRTSPGNISYDPENHDHMVRTRAEKVRRVARRSRRPRSTVRRPATFSSSAGAAPTARSRPRSSKRRRPGKSVASVHLRHLNPLPPDLGHILREYRKVLVPEINSGQLVRVLRAEYLVDAVGFNRVRGLPLASEEIYEAINQLLGSKP